MASYYDMDAILAQEELVPCTNLFDFSYLGHLDPDARDDQKHYLPEDSRFKLPIWAVEKWAMLGFVRVLLPRHYGRKARERIEADPSEVNLRKRNERFFMAGRMLVDLVEQSSQNVTKAIPTSSRRNQLSGAFEQVFQEAASLRKTLLLTFTGERLRQTLDWSLSSVGDDVTSYTTQLTEMERRLFHNGATAATAHLRWRIFGKRRMLLRPPPNSHDKPSSKRAVTPEINDEGRSDKRARQ